jgi:hypothetical protein
MTDETAWEPVEVTATVSLPADADTAEVAQVLADAMPETDWDMWAEVLPATGSPATADALPTTFHGRLHLGRSLHHPDADALVRMVGRSWEQAVHDRYGDNAMLGAVSTVDEAWLKSGAPAPALMRRTSGH